MSENNNEKDRITEHDEPIESIEKTVEDLKRKIQELSDEQEAAQKDADPTTSEKISEFTDNAKEIVSSSIDELKEKANRVTSSEEMAKTIAYIRENAMKAVTGARVKIDEIRQDPKTIESTDRARNAIRNVADSVSEKAHQASDYIYEHMDDNTKENLANAYDSAEKAINEGTRKVAKEVNDFCNRPDVQEKVGKAKETAARWLNKGSDALKDILKGKDED